VNFCRTSIVIIGIILGLIASAATSGGIGFVTPALASDLTIEDRMSRQDPLQDNVTICHIPSENRSDEYDINVGESVVPEHLAHGDRIGHCLPIKHPTITVEAPSSCIITENGRIAYARVILSGFPIGSVIMTGIMTGPQSSVFPLQIELQAETYSIPIGFCNGEKTVTAFSDANRNSKQDPGEVSTTKTFPITCTRNS
jgi:hypothetical protein